MNQLASVFDAATAPEQQRIVLPLAPSLERRRLQVYLGFVVSDIVAVLCGFALASQIYFGGLQQDTMLLARVHVPIYLTAALALQAYSRAALCNTQFAIGRVVAALFATETVLLLVAFATKSTDEFSRVGSMLGLGISTALIVSIRMAARPMVRSLCGKAAMNVLVIDDGGFPLRVPHAFHIDARQHHLSPDLADPHTLDRVGLYMMNMDRVLVSCPPARRQAWALVLKSANVIGEIVDQEVLALGAIGASRGQNYGSLVVSSGPLGMRARAMKRALDLTLAGGAVLFLAPVLALVAVLIKLEDGGPVLFVQKRTGRGNRFFDIYKFRSMRAERSDVNGNRSASLEDDRVTLIGRFIRRTSLDELPQLFNVLRGEMSIVGPRPHAIGSLAGAKLFWEVDHRYWLRHSLKPGLTGLAQVRGYRGATDTEDDLADRLQSDLEYLSGWSIWRDLKIILATIRVLVHSRAF